MTEIATITSAADCLRHIKYAIPEDDFTLAVLYIELLVAQECHKTVIEAHQEAMEIINRTFPKIPK